MHRRAAGAPWRRIAVASGLLVAALASTAPVMAASPGPPAGPPGRPAAVRPGPPPATGLPAGSGAHGWLPRPRDGAPLPPGLATPRLDGFADPAIVRDGERWWVYATNTDEANVPVATSTDLLTWEPAGDALPDDVFPTWAEKGSTWAPGVAHLDGRWVLYLGAPWPAQQRQCVGVAVADSPAGPFRDALGKPLTCGAVAEAWGLIDPQPQVGPDGTPYLFWKDTSAPRQLWAAPLRADGLALAAPPVHLLDAGVPWENGGIENPAPSPRPDGSWLLAYSGNWWTDERYAVGWARCAGPLGPCERLSVDGPWLATGGGLVGPGGQSFTTGPTGEPWMAFHTWDPARPSLQAGGPRRLHTYPVQFTAAGPVLGSRPPGGAVQGVERPGGALRIWGWAADPDGPARGTAAAAEGGSAWVVVRVDGVAAGAVPASVARPELGAFFGLDDDRVGFDVTLTPPPGGREACLWAEGSAPGWPTRLGCVAVTDPAGG